VGSTDQGIEASRGRYSVIPRVLVFVLDGGDVLLLKGAPTKRIWANCYNGVGGHVEAGEDVYAAALRETREETGLDVHDLCFRGLIHIDAGQATGIMLAVFTAHSATRETISSAEGTLEWVPLGRLQEYDLVTDLPVLLERIADQPDGAPPFFARYRYDEHDELQIAFAEGR
jgi:8-oxo-dGTP diphosphatase